MVVKGIRSINPRAHHLNVEHCNNMTFENLYLNTLVRNSDTDGINTRNSSFIKIFNSVIATGGDCISLDDGSTDFSISNITCGPARFSFIYVPVHIKLHFSIYNIGSLGKYLDPAWWLPVRDIHVKKILFRDTFSGIHIMTYPKPIENQVHDVYFEDIVMDNVRNPIVIDQEYNTENATTSSRVKISNIHIRNVRGTSNTPTVVNLKCSKTFPCEGLYFFNIDLKYNGRGPDQTRSPLRA
uniref:Polygalacturonase n=1 Tax=Kalanchoe fedtschenkoi TaxID=63787 RepID=A0A7N0V1I8_KALFE